MAEVPGRPTWTDTVQDAADLALLGIVAMVASLPVITTGAAIAAASAAVHDRCVEGDLPSWRTTGYRFVRALLPGSVATLVAAAVAVLLLFDVRLVAIGVVPGGSAMTLATVAVAIALVGFAALTVMEIGRRGGRGWVAAVRAAAGTGLRRPVVLAAAAGIAGLAIALGMLVPFTAPLAIGYVLFALHVTAGRLAPASPAAGFTPPRA